MSEWTKERHAELKQTFDKSKHKVMTKLDKDMIGMLKEIERLQEENAKLKEEAASYDKKAEITSKVINLELEVGNLKDENAKLKEQLASGEDKRLESDRKFIEEVDAQMKEFKRTHTQTPTSEEE